jgi:hypothetical protein
MFSVVKKMEAKATGGNQTSEFSPNAMNKTVSERYSDDEDMNAGLVSEFIHRRSTVEQVGDWLTREKFPLIVVNIFTGDFPANQCIVRA